MVEAETNAELRELWPTFDDARRRAVYDPVIEKVIVSPAKPGANAFDSDRLRAQVRF